MNGQAPSISIVTPAFNAAATIDRMFASVAGQRRADWEHIVVDDGSSDRTAAIAEGHATRDARVRLLRQDNAGAAAARNRGLAAARGEWVLFLDADDTIRHDHFARMLARAAREPAADVISCGYRRCAADGRVVARYAAPTRDDIARQCEERPPTAIHASLFRRTLLARLGGFDETLATREDWELWARIARSQARIAIEPRLLANYWNSPGSLTRDGVRMIRDAATVMRRHRPRSEASTGERCDEQPGFNASILRNVLWTGGVSIAAGGDGLALADEVGTPIELAEPAALAEPLLDGLMIGSGGSFDGLVSRWDEIEARMARFLGRIADAAHAPGLDFALLRAIEAQVVRTGSIRGRRRIGGTFAVALGPRTLIGGVAPPERCEVVMFKAPLLRPRSLFLFPAPALAPLTGREVRALVRDRLAAGLAGRLLAHDRLAEPTARALRAVALVRRALRRLAGRRGAPEPRGPAAALGALAQARLPNRADILEWSPTPLATAEETPGGGSRESWDAFFLTQDPWNYGSAYEQLKYERTLALLPGDRPIGRALELACAEGMFTARLAPLVGQLRATDISEVALGRAEARCVGRGIANVDFAALDFFRQPIGGPWELIVASEVLYYMDEAGQLDGFVAKVGRALAPGGLFLHAHAYEVTDPVTGNPGHTGFDWGDPFGVQTISAALRAAPALERVRAITTDLYLVELYRRVDEEKQGGDGEVVELPLDTELERSVAECVVWNGAIRTRQQAEAEERTYEVPVLMYHRVAADGPADLAEWRCTAEAFEHQLRFLRRRGYRSIAVDEWEEARVRSGSLRGRPILITFDDAYLDFHDTAWPILERNGFSAHVFVVTGKVGGTSDWDAEFGPPAPLMDWPQIRDLHARGATFGSHLETHRAADRLPAAELFGEAVRSRALLEERLGVPVRTIAPPYGATDGRVEEICLAAGYTRLFRADGGIAQVCGPRLDTPRIDVAGHDDIAAFAAKVGRDDEPPEAGDRP